MIKTDAAWSVGSVSAGPRQLVLYLSALQPDSHTNHQISWTWLITWRWLEAKLYTEAKQLKAAFWVCFRPVTLKSEPASVFWHRVTDESFNSRSVVWATGISTYVLSPGFYRLGRQFSGPYVPKRISYFIQWFFKPGFYCHFAVSVYNKLSSVHTFPYPWFM